MSLNNKDNYDVSREAEKDFRVFLYNFFSDKYFAICHSDEWQDKNEHWDVCATNRSTKLTEFFDIKTTEYKYRGNGNYSISLTDFEYLSSIDANIATQYHFVFQEYSNDGRDTGQWIVVNAIDLMHCIKDTPDVIYKQTNSYVIIKLQELMLHCKHKILENDIPW